MTTPTISTAGATDGIFLITDQDDVVHRIPKNNLGNAVNSSNANSYRIELFYVGGVIVLIFASAAEVTAFLSLIDDQY